MLYPKLKIFLVLLFLVACTDSRDISVYFTPSPDCEDAIVRLIDNTQNSLDAALYTITSKRLSEALMRAQKRGVFVRILTDRLQASNKNSQVRTLKANGVNIRVHSRYKIEHNKFAVFDAQIVSTGSYNWTSAAMLKNSENCLFIRHNKKIVAKFLERFAFLWQVNSPQKSDQWFQK